MTTKYTYAHMSVTNFTYTLDKYKSDGVKSEVVRGLINDAELVARSLQGIRGLGQLHSKTVEANHLLMHINTLTAVALDRMNRR